MDINPFFLWNVILTLIYAPLIYGIRNNATEMKRIDILLNKTREELPTRYVTKIDLLEDMERLFKRLDNLELITYLEPCSMCKEVIKSARIKKVYFLLKNNNPKRKTIYKAKYKHIELKGENIIKKFFKVKRFNN